MEKPHEITIGGRSVKVHKVYAKRAMCFCPKHVSSKGTADLDVTLIGQYSGYFRCWSCGYHGKVTEATIDKLLRLRGEVKASIKILDWGQYHQDCVRRRYTSGVFPPVKVSVPTLTQVGWGWDGQAHTFPERSARGKIIGMLRRFPDRNKGVTSGSERGLSIPTLDFDPSKRLYITEGVSDLCVILECGCQGIARPNSNSCNEMVSEWLDTRQWIGGVAIVADNDDGGSKGATALQLSLENQDADIWTPSTHNDLYDFYVSEGRDRVKSWLAIE